MEGRGYRLRPVEMHDASLIIDLRTADSERLKYVHPVSSDVSLQEKWLESYFDRQGDYYFVVERIREGNVEGLISIYDIHEGDDGLTGEWGRWVIRKGSLAAVESALLIYKTAFEILGLTSLYCITVSENSSVISFHDNCGLEVAEVMEKRFELCDGVYDGVKHICRPHQWPEIQARLEPQAQRIASRINRT